MKPALKRILTAVIGIPVIIAILFAPISVMSVAVALCSFIGIYEFYGAVNIRKESPILNCTGCIAALIVPFCTFLKPMWIVTIVFLYLFVNFFLMLISKRKIKLSDISVSVMGLIYIPYMMSHILFTRQLEFGNIIVWLVFLGSFMTDSCAYFSGMTLGKHKLCPSISPKKTIEGAVGGVLGCGLSFLLFAYIVNTFLSGLTGGASMDYLAMFILGLICSFVAQVGDLTASLIKREYGIKDFGTLFPGHGGMLDRCDSIILVAPTIFIFASQIGLF